VRTVARTSAEERGSSPGRKGRARGARDIVLYFRLSRNSVSREVSASTNQR
jgi:hypothetical protein